MELKLKEAGPYLQVLDGKVCLLPNPTPPCAEIRQHLSQDWGHVRRNPKGGSRLRFVVVVGRGGGLSRCGRPWREVRRGPRVPYTVQNWSFTPSKGQCWLLVKYFKCPKDCLKILSWYIFLEKHKKIRSEREEATSLQGWVSQGDTLCFNRFIKLYSGW